MTPRTSKAYKPWPGCWPTRTTVSAGWSCFCWYSWVGWRDEKFEQARLDLMDYAGRRRLYRIQLVKVDFVGGVFAAAGLPLLYVPVSHSYPTQKLRAHLLRKAGLAELADAPPAAQPVRAVGKGEAQEAETSVLNCPKWDAPMVLRKAQKRANAGHSLWVCSYYPQCPGIRRVVG